MIDLTYNDVVRIEHARKIERANHEGWWWQGQRSPRTSLRMKLTGTIVALATRI
jgi:hypothetical protein